MPVLAHDRTGPSGSTPVLLLHAGVADRRMWDPLRDRLSERLDVVRVDLRGFGDSTARPDPGWSHVADVRAVLDELDIDRVDVVGASLGAGVAVELALEHPARVASLLLAAPGGSLIPAMTDELRAFVVAEDTALEAGDLAAAAQANVDWWLVGPHREAGSVPAELRELVHRMQLRAFELTVGWDEIEEAEPEVEPLDRLGEIAVPSLVLAGALDLDAIAAAAGALEAGIPGARRVDWDGVAHLPALERPQAFASLVEDWLSER